MDITFSVFSYNQQETVISTLESIKYQVERNGKQHKIQLLIVDDASLDKTYYLEQKWADFNSEYFDKIDILPSDKHRGINQNVLRSLDYIQGEYFKEIAGDDLLAEANLFEILQGDKSDLFIASYFCFNEFKNLSVNAAHYMFWGKRLNDLQRCSRFVMVPITTLSLIRSKGLIDEGYKKALNRCMYIEDVPVWEYLMKKEKLAIKFINIPIILYRMDGQNISLAGTSNPLYEKFKIDKNELYSDRVKNANGCLEKYIAFMNKKREMGGNIFYSIFNPYRYYHRFQMFIREKEIDSLKNDLEQKYKDRNRSFLHEIEKRSKNIYERLL